MVRSRRTWMMSLLFLGGLCLSSKGVHAAGSDDLLDKVPADAWVVGYVPSLQQLSDNVGDVAKVFGLPIMDPVGMLVNQMGIEKGFDRHSGVLVIAMDFKKYKGKPVAFVLTSKDPKTLVSNFIDEDDDDKDADTNKNGKEAKAGDKEKKPAKGIKEDEDGLIACKINDEPHYARIQGNFVTISPNKEVAKALISAKPSDKISGVRKELFSKRSVSISIAAARVTTAYQDEIAGYVKMMTAAMGPQAAGMSTSMDQAMQKLRQLDTLDFCIDVGKAGFSLTTLAAAKSGTELEEEVKSMPTSTSSLLKGLPGPDYCIAMGFLSGGKTKSKADVQKMLDTVLGNQDAKDKIDTEQLKKLVNLIQELGEGVKGMALSVSPLSDSPAGVFALNGVIECSDSAKLVSSMGNVFEMVKKIPAKEEDRKKLNDAFTYKAGAETIGSIKTDQVQINAAKVDEDEDVSAMTKKLLGPDGLTLRMGPADSHHVVFSLGGGKEQFGVVAKSAQSSSSTLGSDTGIMKASESLPKRRAAEIYIAADSCLKLANRIARAVAEDSMFPADLKPIPQPVSMVVSAESGTSRFDLVVPMGVITGIRDAMNEAHSGKAHGKHHAKADSDDDDDKPVKKDKKKSDDDEDDDDQPHKRPG